MNKFFFVALVVSWFALASFCELNVNVGLSGGNRTGVEITNQRSEPNKVNANVTLSHGHTNYISFYGKGEKTEALAVIEVGGLSDIWGKINFSDDMYLLVGRNGPPLAINRNGPVMWQTAEDLCNPWPGRFDILQLGIKKFTLALLNTAGNVMALEHARDDGDSVIMTLPGKIKHQEAKFLLPRIEAVIDHHVANWFIKFGGGLQVYKYTYADTLQPDTSETSTLVPSYMIGMQTGFIVGPLDFTVRGVFGTNLGRYIGGVGGFAGRNPVIYENGLHNNNTFSGYSCAKYKFSDRVTSGLGLGYVMQKHDLRLKDSGDPAMYAFINSSINLFEGKFGLHPELGYLNEMKDVEGNDEPVTTIVHLKLSVFL